MISYRSLFCFLYYGTEVMTTDGYLKIKIAEPNVWRFKHIIEWEKYHGEVPEGMLISFKDGDGSGFGKG